MERIKIGETGIETARIGLGTWAIGGWLWGGTDEAASIRVIQEAVDRGVNLIDTAPVYGFGLAEEWVGRALVGRREKAVIATKVGLEWDEGRKLSRNSSRKRIHEEINASLKRLGTDRIDIYQVHWPDPRIPIEETAGALVELQRAGKIRALGVSNYQPEQMERWCKVAPLHTNQPPYNLFERSVERRVLPWCREHHVATLTYGAICRGLLSGRMTAQTRFSGDDVRRFDPKFRPPRFNQYLAAVQALDRFAQDALGKRVIHLALRWVLDHPEVSVALWGVRRPEQLTALDGVWDWRLDAEAMRKIDEMVHAHVTDPVGPEFMAPPA